MNHQSQNFSQGNAAGGNSGVTGLFQYQQQNSQQQQNHAMAAHLQQARVNFNGNLQHFSQQQTQHQPMNINGVQGINPTQLNQLRAVQQQLQLDLAAQQTIQATSMNVHQHQHQHQHQQRQQVQQNLQASLNRDPQQRPQTQTAENSANTDVIKDLFNQLQSINQKLEILSSPNKETKTAADSARKSQQQLPPPSNANNASNPGSNDAQPPRHANTMVQPSQRQALPKTTNTNVNTSRLSASQIIQQRRQDTQTTANQPLRVFPPTGANSLRQHGQPQILTTTAGQYARQMAQSQPRAPPNTTQQIHRLNPSANNAKTVMNPNQSPRSTIQNGKAKTATANMANGSYTRKQPVVATNTGVRVAKQTQNTRPPITNTRPQTVPAQYGQTAAASGLASRQPIPGTNRPDPNMITCIKVLSYKMHQIVRTLPQELADAFSQLHPAHAYTMANTMVFKFEKREREADESGENTNQASFFLDKLKAASSLAQRKMTLLGLKCHLCNHRQGYVKGSTSFVDIENPTTLSLFASVIQSRTKHLLACPDCKQEYKNVLGSFAPTAQDNQILLSLANKWLLVVKASYFNMPLDAFLAPAPAPPQQRTEVPEFFSITEDSIYEDLVSSMAMGKAMGGIRWDDLSEGMEKLLSPLMEVFLMSFRLQSNGHAGIELCCKHASAESTEKMIVWSFQEPFSVDDVFCKRIWDFFQQHCKTSSKVPEAVRKLVCISSQPPIEELKFVGKKWSEYASRIVQNQKAIHPKPDVKLLLPMYIATPFEYLPARRSGTFPLKGNFDDNDVVMISAYRNFIGNRRFRQTVSQFRALYFKLPPNKQFLIAEKTISLIKRRGGSFYSKDGFLARFNESFAYTQKALQNGFPEMMCPVFSAEAKSVVFDIEFTRMVDILPNRKESINRVKKIIFESASKPKDGSAEASSTLNRRGQSLVRSPANSEFVDLTNNDRGTGKSPVREGQPIVISTKHRSQLNGQKVNKGASKRKQDTTSIADSSKRLRKSS